MDTNHLAEQIATAARFSFEAATFLAEYALSGNYSGGELHIGIGDYGVSHTLYCVVYPCNGRWYIASGYRLNDGRWCLIDAANGQTAQTLRGCFHFEHNGHFVSFTPDMPPEPPGGAAPAVALLPDEDEPGTVYVLMLDTPLGTYKHSAQFYIGWARNLDGRIFHHAAGRGAAFTRAAVERGIAFRVVFTMPGTRRDERAIKNRKNARKFLASVGVDLTGQAVAA